MKRVYSLLILVFTIIVACTISVSARGSVKRPLYTDVDGMFWAYDAIEYAKERKYFSGYADGSFLPNNTITRAEASKVIAMYINRIRNPISNSRFDDISSEDWFAPYVEAVADVFPGMNNQSEFRPNDPMTREDTVYILVNVKKLNYKIKFLDMSLLDGFSDYNLIDDEVKPQIAMGIQLSLLSGYSDGTLRPKNPLTRAEFATLMYRATNLSK